MIICDDCLSHLVALSSLYGANRWSFPICSSGLFNGNLLRVWLLCCFSDSTICFFQWCCKTRLAFEIFEKHWPCCYQRNATKSWQGLWSVLFTWLAKVYIGFVVWFFCFIPFNIWMVGFPFKINLHQYHLVATFYNCPVSLCIGLGNWLFIKIL